MPKGGRVVAIAGLILAAIALVALLLTGLLGFPSLVVALVSSFAGLVLSALGYRSPSARTLALVGLVLSLIEVALVVLFLLVVTPVSVHSQ